MVAFKFAFILDFSKNRFTVPTQKKKKKKERKKKKKVLTNQRLKSKTEPFKPFYAFLT